jgi:hypothetical protein
VNTRIETKPTRLRLIQALWAILVGWSAVSFILSIPTYHHQLSHPAHAVLRSLTRSGLSLSVYADYLTALIALFGVVFLFLSLLIAYRRFDDIMGLVTSASLVLWAAGNPPSAKAVAGTYHQLAPLANSTTALALLTLVVFLFVFPDGRVIPRWATIPVILFVGGTLTLYLLTGAPSTDNSFFGLLVIPADIAGVIAQTYRYRRVAGTQQRQQMKWVFFALTFAIAVSIFTIFAPLPTVGVQSTQYDLTSTTILSLTFLVIPVAITIAILRYRLWDIDVLINRTLVYGLLTVALALIYIAGVIGLQALFRAFTGQGSGLAVAISTLAIAALFHPLRGGIQSFIDRRFYRRKYDAVRTLAAFNTRLRDDVDLDQLTADLIGIVDETMQPAHVSLWLR